MSDNGRLIINTSGEMFQVVKPETPLMKDHVRLQVTSHVGNLDTVPGGQFTLSSDLTRAEAMALACKLADAAGYAAAFTEEKTRMNALHGKIVPTKPPTQSSTMPANYTAADFPVGDYTQATRETPVLSTLEQGAKLLRDSGGKFFRDVLHGKIVPAKPATQTPARFDDVPECNGGVPRSGPFYCPSIDVCSVQGCQRRAGNVPAKPGEGK